MLLRMTKPLAFALMTGICIGFLSVLFTTSEIPTSEAKPQQQLTGTSLLESLSVDQKKVLLKLILSGNGSDLDL